MASCAFSPRECDLLSGCGIGFGTLKRSLCHSNMQTNTGAINLDSLDLISLTCKVDVWVELKGFDGVE